MVKIMNQPIFFLILISDQKTLALNI